MSDAQSDTDPSNLIHQVNNLLGVIYTQVEIAKASTDPEMVEASLQFILESAKQTDRVVKAARVVEQRRRGDGGAQSDSGCST